MRNKTSAVRRALTTAGVVLSAFSLAAVLSSAGAGASTNSAKKHDPYLFADTRINVPATIGGAGSTFAAPLENAAQAFYTTRNSRATINGYQGVGSGSGEADILKKVVDWGGSDVPMLTSDIKKSEPSGANYTLADFLQVPIGLGGVALAYNVPGIKDKALVLNANVLAWIYEGQVTYWNSKVIQNLNKGVKLPHTRIVVVARGDASGTSFIFTNFLHAAASKAWPTPPSKSPPTLPPGGVAGSGNPGVAADIENTPNSIGYVEYSYLLLNPSLLKGVASIVNKSGKALQPTIAGVADAAAARPNVSATGFSIVWQWGAKTYPIAGYTWAIIWKQNQTNDAEGALLVKYLDWLAHSGAVNGIEAGQDVAAQQGYVPLPANIQQLARKTLLQCVGSHGQALLTTTGA